MSPGAKTVLGAAQLSRFVHYRLCVFPLPDGRRSVFGGGMCQEWVGTNFTYMAALYRLHYLRRYSPTPSPVCRLQVGGKVCS